MMESSLREYVREQISEYAGYVKKYFDALAMVAEHPVIDAAHSPEQIIKNMAAVDDNLQKAIEQIASHQLRQQQIIQVQDEIQQHNLALLAIIQKLGSAREELDQSLIQAKLELKVMKYASDSNVQFTEVLSYASKLSKYTSAPPNFEQMKRDGNMDFEKPYPDEEKMRRSMLYWQNAPQQRMEDKFESSDDEMSTSEEIGESTTTDKQMDGTSGAPSWSLDLNP